RRKFFKLKGVIRWLSRTSVDGDFASDWDRDLWIDPKIMAGEGQFLVRSLFHLRRNDPRRPVSPRRFQAKSPIVPDLDYLCLHGGSRQTNPLAFPFPQEGHY